MKLESTNITIKANEEMNMASIKVKNHDDAFMIRHELLEEVRDLLNDYFEMVR